MIVFQIQLWIIGFGFRSLITFVIGSSLYFKLRPVICRLCPKRGHRIRSCLFESHGDITIGCRISAFRNYWRLRRRLDKQIGYGRSFHLLHRYLLTESAINIEFHFLRFRIIIFTGIGILLHL